MANSSPPEARKMASTSKKVINTLSGMVLDIRCLGLGTNDKMPPGRGVSVDEEKGKPSQRIGNSNRTVVTSTKLSVQLSHGH